MKPLLYNEADSKAANKAWKATCGPHAIAAACGKTLEQVREAMVKGGVNYRGWMSPTQVSKTLITLGQVHNFTSRLKTQDLCEGINRVQWEGKWLNPGVAGAHRIFSHPPRRALQGRRALHLLPQRRVGAGRGLASVSSRRGSPVPHHASLDTLMIKPEYLGDGVYASSTAEFPLVLTTGHHEPALADNKIAFEPEVIAALEIYITRIKQDAARATLHEHAQQDHSP